MAGLNKVMLIGNVGKDPEMRYTANGSAVTTFSLAVNRNFTGADGERREETDWFDVVTWTKLAELCSQFLQKGRQAYVEGRLQTRSWEGQDGQKHYKTEVVAQTVLFLGSGPGGRGGGAARMEAYEDAAPAASGPASHVDPDDLPFE
ncbi:MAG: single-stranded DNA-binding protein [Dehalococcoidia bacterium]|nr:single-stranded DNA-binding protein [Dehalococcoidia bacterium]